MSEATAETQNSNQVKLNGLFAMKMGMSTIYTEVGESVPVTVLKVGNWVISQIKTKEKDGYNAIQLASGAKRGKRTSNAERGHLKKAGFENGAYHVKEIRQDNLPDGIQLGQLLSVESLAKGDVVSLTAKSKGRGFSGVVKRYNFGGGPGAHGSKFHRQPGSSGNRTWPGRVMPGKRFPGQFGFENVTVKNVKVMDVIPEESVVIVRGQVPGAQNTLVRLMKE